MSETSIIRRGVSLLELMIVVAAISILAAIAYPNYRVFMDRAGRNEAKALLLEIATNQERFYLTARRFGSLTELGYVDPLVSDSGNYTISVPVHTALTFVITANYNHAGNERTLCSSYSINNYGERTSRGTLEDCWNDRR